MKRTVLFLSILFVAGSISAQKVFKKYGIDKEPMTLSKGRYVETFPNEEVMRVGSILLNTKTNKVIEFLEEDTTELAYKAENASRFVTIDPMAEKYPWLSPYVYCNNNPVINIDPTGEDYWSTNDTDQIRAFLNAVGSGSSQFDFSSGWNHMTDAEFSDRLSYNDETGKYMISYGTVENGEVVINARSFDANITPVSFSGEGYPGAFVYEPRGKFGYHFGKQMGFGTDAYFNGFITWRVNASGRITGIKPITGYAPMVGKGGSFKSGKFTQKMGKAKGNMSANRAVQQKEFDAVVKQLNLTKDEAQELHRLIGGQGYNYQEILLEAKAFFNK